jgi:hypothetical protein
MGGTRLAVPVVAAAGLAVALVAAPVPQLESTCHRAAPRIAGEIGADHFRRGSSG